VKLKRKINLKKDHKTIKKIRIKLKKITYYKLRLNDQIENKLKFYKKIKKLKIKRIRIKFNILKKSKDNSEILLGQTRFSRGRERKAGEGKKVLVSCYNSNTTTHRHKKKRMLWRFQLHSKSWCCVARRRNMHHWKALALPI